MNFKKYKKILIFIGILFIYGVSYNIFIYYRLQLRPVVEFMIKNFIPSSCSTKSDCEEKREIPKGLQNKKIVFSDNADIEFDASFSNIIPLAELDTLGYLDASHFYKNRKETIDPKLRKSGYLKNREYKIIRAIYHYNCFYCFDSDDYSYLIIEDKDGNRFISLLDDYIYIKNKYTELSWDEYVPYYIQSRLPKEELIVELVGI